MYGASISSVNANAAFKQKQGFPFPLLCDTERNLSLAFGTVHSARDSIASRYTFVIGADGVIEQSIRTKKPGDQARELLSRQ